VREFDGRDGAVAKFSAEFTNGREHVILVRQFERRNTKYYAGVFCLARLANHFTTR
jgi:hypothetical protein